MSIALLYLLSKGVKPCRNGQGNDAHQLEGTLMLSPAGLHLSHPREFFFTPMSPMNPGTYKVPLSERASTAYRERRASVVAEDVANHPHFCSEDAGNIERITGHLTRGNRTDSLETSNHRALPHPVGTTVVASGSRIDPSSFTHLDRDVGHVLMDS